MANMDFNKMKGKFPGMENFAHKHLAEFLTVIAIALGAFSAWMHLFIGTLGWSLLFVVIGAALGIFFPMQLDAVMKKIYGFSGSGKKIGMVFGEIIKMAIALFLPFLYFGFLGVLSGTAYQYYIQRSKGGHYGDKAA